MAQPVTASRGPHVQRLLFSNAEEMSRAMHGVNIEMNVLKDGYFPYGLLSAQLGDCVLDIGDAGAAVTVAGAVDARSALLVLPMRREGDWRLNGVECEASRMAIYRPGAEAFAYTGGPVQWTALQVPEARWQQMVELFGARGAERRREGMEMIALTPQAQATLHRAVAQAAALLRDHPHMAELPQINETLRQSLLYAFARTALERENAAGAPTPGFLHSRIVKAAEDFLQAHPEVLLFHVADLCKATGVSERTLRNAFNGAFGMGPIRYLRIRRLNQVRRLLENPDDDVGSVTEAAMRFAFYDLGRFARDYQRLFGEKPSETWSRQRAQMGALMGSLG